MKKKNGNTTDTNVRKTVQKNRPVALDNIGVTDKVKPKAGRGTSNEGTTVSYDEER
jgi:hypothetical protein